MIAFDKFDSHYIKALPDFNNEMLMVSFQYGRFQKIDDNHIYFLCHALTQSGLTFTYKPEQNRFPDNLAILFNTVDYVINRKDKDGNWSRVTIKPSPVDTWVIEHVHKFSDLLDPSYQLAGNLMIQQALNQQLPSITHTSALDFGCLGFVSLAQDTFNLPDIEHKPSATNKKSNRQYSMSKAPLTKLTQEQAYQFHCEAQLMTDKVCEQIIASGEQPLESGQEYALYHAILTALFETR